MDTSSRIVIGIIFAGMMAVDMGGPVNKAAYVIGTGLLATGEYGVMAAVMAGGMVPPLAIALCTTFFPNASLRLNVNPVLPTMLWASPSSPKELFHSPQPIRFA